MELILISNTKLKIMLNENDMQRYKIGSESDCAEPDTRRAIRSLLDCAREQIGFNTEGEEIFVQLYTSKKGGCELFVTKCHDSALCEESAERLIKSVGSSYDSHYSSRRRDAEHVSSTTVKERKMVTTTQAKKERIAFSRYREKYAFPRSRAYLEKEPKTVPVCMAHQMPKGTTSPV